jgi:FtsP/CotA-like multicopper oxidase with cupredoxin domain
MTLHTFLRSAARADRRRSRLTALAAITAAALITALLQAGPAGAAPRSHAAAASDHAAASAHGRLGHANALGRPTATLHSAPVGKLTPRGCTQGTGTSACDLFAMAGTASVLGTSIPIWGFSATGVSGSATAPGPVLVVQQGDRVTITLHNQLTENVSLALPGQAPAAFTGSAGDDTTGIATGATRNYVFTAGRPGTFLYEAGHTSGGARQVAMGLAGALVVLPGDGSAYGAQAGMPATPYDDDAVLVLSEIDPRLNANPTTFDMRDFKPRYRLINGKPYPSSDPVSTDQAHTVLLRYVNVGSEMHAMSLLGGSQVEVGQDGHPAKFTTTVTAESIEPGQTLDAEVHMPSGPESKLAVYESAQHLDNNGQNTADPQQLAFGGMLTFLDTNAPAPSTDGVGPVATHVKASPNPSDGKVEVTVTADLSDATTGGSNVAQAEFVIDDAVTTGAGFGVPMSATFGTVAVTGAHGVIPVAPAGNAPCAPPTGPIPVALSCLDAGKHTIFVRALDSAGNWGVVGSVIFNLPKTGPQTTNGSLSDTPANGKQDVALSATGDDSDAAGVITAAEYFVDTVGANGSGAALTLNRSATVVSEDAVLTAAQVAAMSEGTHHVFVHSQDSLGLWGPPLDVPLVVDLTGPGVDAASVGPNPTNGIVSDKSNPGYLLISAQLTDRDAGGATQSALTDAEAFIDPVNVATLAGGSGLQLIAVDGKVNSPSEAVYGLIPLSQAKALTNGEHHVYVRGRDAAGNWGPLFAVSLIVDKVAPVLGTPVASPNPTNGAANLTVTAAVTDASLIAAAEYWFGTVDPGVGHGTSVPVSVIGGQLTVTVPLAGIGSGSQQLNLRVKDLAGNWSGAVATSVTVQKPNLIFSNRFEPADYGAWSATRGGVSNTAAAAMPTADEPSSTRGLAVRMAGGQLNAASYVTDNSPTAEPGYHARFTFNPNTLTSGTVATTVLTLFEARTSANGQVFTLQFRVSGGVAQLRTVLSRTTGGALVGAWVNVAKTPQSVQLDWTASTSGTLTLRIGGTVRSTQSGNTSSLRIDTALLGVTAGYTTTRTGTTAGTAYFDSFASGRVSIP